MKKTVRFLAAVAIAAAVAACSGEAQTPAPFVEGVVLDASMNGVTIVTGTGDTLDLSTMDVSRERYPGVLTGDSVKVKYSDADRDGARVPTVDSLVVTVHSPYYYIQGAWVMPDPVKRGAEQGFRLEPGGAESIGMATLLVEDWELFVSRNELVLRVKSIGNGNVSVGYDTLRVEKLNADSLVLSKDGTVLWRVSRRK